MDDTSTTTAADTDQPHPLTARLWERMASTMEAKGADRFRAEMLAGARGSVLELGAGNGANFRHYPDTVERVLAVEPEPYLRERAAEAAARASIPIEVVPGLAEHLPAGEDEFDVAVACMVLCSVSDLPGALQELRRVLRPGGQLRFWEHVRARDRLFGMMQRAWDVPWVPLSGWGCHTARDTHGAITAAGFEIQNVRRFGWRTGILDWAHTPQALGMAVNPPEGGAQLS